MNSKTKNILKMVAVIAVLIMVLMDLDIVVINMLNPYKFWITVIAFGTLLIASK